MSRQTHRAWPETSFSEVVAHSAFGPRFSGDLYTEDGNVATLRTTDISEDGTISYPTMPLAKIDEGRFADHFLKPGDLVITRSGRVGTAAVFGGFSMPVLPGAFLIRFRLAPRADSRFFRYFFNSPGGQHRLLSVARGAAQQNLNSTNVLKLSIPLPPVVEQEAIVDVLSTYDDMIANNRRRIDLLEQSARLLFKEWFVDLRYPGHEHDNIVEGMPKGWECKKVDALLAKAPSTKKIMKEEFLENGETPCVDQSREFIGGYTDDADARIESPLPMVVFGDHTRILKFIDFPFARGADGTQLLYPNDPRISPEFFFFLLDAIDLSNYFYARHFKFLKAQEVRIPSERLIAEFTVFAKDAMKEVSILSQCNRRLAKARDLLLVRLMDGRLSV